MFKQFMFLNYQLWLIFIGVSSHKLTEKFNADVLRNSANLPVDKKSINEILNRLNSMSGQSKQFPSELKGGENELNNEWRTTEILKSRGYPVESYELITSDGYILEIQRIPSANSYHSPILFQHGISVYSHSWAFPPVNQSILYMLLNAGYDCWLSNLRGTPYGLKHKFLDSSSQEFWDFGLEEMAIYDVSAVIDFVLNATQSKHLYYVGHSMGTTLGFILLSSKLEYNNKIKLFIAEAPVAYIHHLPSVIVKTAAQSSAIVDTIFTVSKLLNIYIFPPMYDLSSNMPAFCLIHRELCLLIEADIAGDNPDEFSIEIFQFFLHGMIPNSIRTYLHYEQIYQAKSFQKYDFGALKNLFTYGQLTPPQFNVELITTPTVFYVGLNDHLSALEDVKLLEQRLPNHIETYIVEDIKWSHIDFLSAIHSETALNRYLIQILNFFDIIVM